mgnify:FL=1
MNVTVPFDHAFHVYVNVNVLLVALHPTLALLNITYALLNVISLALNAFVLIHTPSVHVNTTVHAVPLLTYAALGVHHVHTGTVLSILLTVILQLHVFHALSCTYIVLLPFALNVHVVRLVVILLYHVQLYLSLFVSVTVAVNVTFPFVCVHAAGLCAILHVGFVVSTVTALLAALALFLFVAPSLTLFAGNVNVTPPFFPLIHSYTIVNVLLDVLPHAVTLFIFKFAALNVKSHVPKLVVLTHAQLSTHVIVILHVAHAFTYVGLGLHHVQLGFVVSIFSTFADNLYVVFHAASTAL